MYNGNHAKYSAYLGETGESIMRARIGVVLGGAFLAVLVLLLAAFAPGAQAGQLPGRALEQAGWAAPPNSLLAQTPPVSCTVGITQTTGKLGNQSFTTAFLLSNVGGLSLIPVVGVPPGSPPVEVPTIPDYYYINVFAGNLINVTISPASAGGNYNLGLEVYDNSQSLIAEDSDPSTFSASTSQVASYSGRMYFRVYQLQTAGTCSGGTYNIAFTNSPPTVTPSRTPTLTPTTGPSPTPYAGAPNSDRFEPNNNFDQATTIGLNVKYDALNFVQWDVNSTDWDNDFFKVRVKPGMLVTCRTLDLKPGTDTNLILYDINLNGINGQDDFNRAGGDLSSSVSYYVTYEGWLYGLIGEGFSRPLSEQAATGYSYECTIGSQNTPTPAPTPTDLPNVPTRTPIPTETPIPSPTLTPTPPFIKIVPLPTATSPGLPTSQVPVSLLAYYDANSSNKYDPGEGIVSISARVIDLTTGKLLAQGLTDTTGRVSFTVSAPGAVQLLVPYLNFSEIILPSGKAVTIRVSSSELPRAIP
jgi:hypothetical protein